ncbi:GcrA family cell cycle regulator [Hyphobacterium sp.]|uniref:GcrA family cell cycle regulator n=1 Tax=Hyphobacterium sp. TaxID=2004662 RepID=UPI003B51944C
MTLRSAPLISRRRAVSEFNGAAARDLVAPDPDVEAGQFLADAAADNGDAADRGAAAALGLRHGECKWPCGQPGTADFHFCKATAMPGHSYCEAHREIAVDRVLEPLQDLAGAPTFHNFTKGRPR